MPNKLKPAEDNTPALLRSKSIEPRKTSCINKKREYLKKKWNQKNNTPAIENNANAIEEGKKKQNHWSNERYYNCQKRPFFEKLSGTPKNKC